MRPVRSIAYEHVAFYKTAQGVTGHGASQHLAATAHRQTISGSASSITLMVLQEPAHRSPTQNVFQLAWGRSRVLGVV